jgi:hypothetical protein
VVIFTLLALVELVADKLSSTQSLIAQAPVHKFLSCSRLRDRTKATNRVVLPHKPYHKYWANSFSEAIPTHSRCTSLC